MKKITLAGLVAIAVIALSQHQASAWVNSKFSIGLNWERQSGANQALWGAWRNGQLPGSEAFAGGSSGHGSPTAPYYTAPQPQGFAPMPQVYPTQGSFDASMLQPYAAQQTSLYQFANYPRPIYYYYTAPIYYYYYVR